MRMTLLNMVFGSNSFGLSAGCGTCLPNGCAVATHSQGDWTESVEGDPDSLWGRSPHLAVARSGFWKGVRASEGRGCFERGTLNADRKANRKGAALYNCTTACTQGAVCTNQLRNSKSQWQCNREERQRDLKHRCLSLSPSPCLLHSSPDVGSSVS